MCEEAFVRGISVATAYLHKQSHTHPILLLVSVLNSLVRDTGAELTLLCSELKRCAFLKLWASFRLLGRNADIRSWVGGVSWNKSKMAFCLCFVTCNIPALWSGPCCQTVMSSGTHPVPVQLLRCFVQAPRIHWRGLWIAGAVKRYGKKDSNAFKRLKSQQRNVLGKHRDVHSQQAFVFISVSVWNVLGLPKES